MSTHLYKEAIAEARQLKELAEQSAKNKIIDALTPRIQAMVEAQLLADDEIAAIPDFEEDAVFSALTTAPEAEEEEAISVDLPDQEVENEASVVVNAAGDVHFSVSDSLSKESKSAEGALINGSSQPTASKNLAERNNLLRRKVRRLDALLQGIRANELSETQRAVVKKSYIKILKETLALREVALNESNDKKTRHAIFITLKEINEMTKRRSSAIFSHLFEAEDGAMDEMEILIGDEDLEALGVEEPEEVDIDALDVSFEMSGEEEGEEEEGFEAEGEEEEGEEELELEEMAMEMDEGDHDEMDEVYEIDESTLRKEIRRLRRIREQAESEAVEVVDSFGGGDEDGDVIVDVDPDDLLNALADELGDVPPPAVESRRRSPRRKTARRNTTTKNVNESASFRKALRENSALKRQLSEMNLFNAKLLYVNKLMQSRNVTHEQKRAIVEALDNAKTIREAKLVYQGLSRSLNKKSTLKESAARRVLGSASKSTRKSGASLNESGVSDRWATLAGIKN